MKNKVFYLALGDSLTEGIGATQGQSFPEKFFRAIKQTQECQLLNLGKSGLSSGELLELINDPKMDEPLRKATHITITTGGNDMFRSYEKNAHFLGYIRAIQTLNQNLKQILRKITETNRNTNVFLMGLYNPGTIDHKLYKLANQIIERINNLYEETAKHFQVHTINPMEALSSRPHYLSDEVHPNDLGYHVLTDLFLTKHNLVCNAPPEVRFQKS
ncbi:hypothetical protein J9303_15770 [Bacillaceae bacterium Marseille-Q3522]|nr:hypothetical protein [Bacillaceae bacterium Marseille-Q3522]